MTLAKLEGHLRKTIGLDAASIGPSTIERAVRSRMAACDEGDIAGYWDRVQALGEESQELIEAVVVPETWFFRDRDAFVAMASFAETEWPKSSEPRRLLSLPCATGEEPYSMAMALFDAGLTSAHFQIDAMDISVRALRCASEAGYGRNSFRGDDLGFRDRHFEYAQGLHRVSRAVRECVLFTRGNIFDPNLPLRAASYDVIFCRNMLIYFDGASQDRAIGVLRHLLSRTGLIFVGPSEASILLRNGFESAAVPRAFSIRRTPASPRPRGAEGAKQAPNALAKPRAPLRSTGAAPAKARPAAASAAPAAEAAPCLEAIQRLADRGRFDEAERSCDTYVRAHGMSADAFCLLGLIRDSKGLLDDAALYYRKALYLEPEHYEALLHLILLLERQGDTRGAHLLNARIARLDRKAAT